MPLGNAKGQRLYPLPRDILVKAGTRKVRRWNNSPQRHRWVAAALLDIEPRLRRVSGYKHLQRDDLLLFLWPGMPSKP